MGEHGWIVLLKYLRNGSTALNSSVGHHILRRGERKDSALNTTQPILPFHSLHVEVVSAEWTKVVFLIHPTIHVKIVERVVVRFDRYERLTSRWLWLCKITKYISWNIQTIPFKHQLDGQPFPISIDNAKLSISILKMFEAWMQLMRFCNNFTSFREHDKFIFTCNKYYGLLKGSYTRWEIPSWVTLSVYIISSAACIKPGNYCQVGYLMRYRWGQ